MQFIKRIENGLDIILMVTISPISIIVAEVKIKIRERGRKIRKIRKSLKRVKIPMIKVYAVILGEQWCLLNLKIEISQPRF